MLECKLPAVLSFSDTVLYGLLILSQHALGKRQLQEVSFLSQVPFLHLYIDKIHMLKYIFRIIWTLNSTTVLVSM